MKNVFVVFEMVRSSYTVLLAERSHFATPPQTMPRKTLITTAKSTAPPTIAIPVIQPISQTGGTIESVVVTIGLDVTSGSESVKMSTQIIDY